MNKYGFNTHRWIVFLTLMFGQVFTLPAIGKSLDGVSLYGIGMFRLLSEEVYIGSLKVPETISEPQQLLSSAVPKQMQVDFVISKLPAHRISRLWKEGIAMNNARKQWEGFGAQILSFTDQFQEPLIRGDRMDITYHPESGTKVYVNDTLFFQEPSHDFFVLLMMTWIGDLPPSQSFKDGVLGLTGGSVRNHLQKQKSSLKMIAGRVKKPGVEVEEVAIAAAKIAPLPKPSKPSKITIATKPVSKKINPRKKMAVKDKPSNPVKAKQPVKRVVVTSRPSPRPPVLMKLSRDALKRIAADQDLMRGSYKRDLINALKPHQQYPSRAWRLGLEGDALVTIRIDRRGQILKTGFIERTGRNMLDRAIEKMVKAAEPLPRMPSQLTQAEFEFTVPFSFQQ